MGYSLESRLSLPASRAARPGSLVQDLVDGCDHLIGGSVYRLGDGT
jgi:hypothetical protein